MAAVRAARKLCRLQGNELLSEFLSVIRSLVGIDQAMVLFGPRATTESGYSSPLYLSSIDVEVVRLFNSSVEFRKMMCRDSSSVHAELLASDVPFNPAIAPLVSRGLRHVYLYELFADKNSRVVLLALDGRSACIQLQQLDILDLFVSVVSRSLSAEASIGATEARATELTNALNSRVVIEQAKGILAERMNVAPDDAFSHLRKMARDARVGLAATASQVIQSCARPIATQMNSATTPMSGNTGGHDIAV